MHRPTILRLPGTALSAAMAVLAAMAVAAPLKAAPRIAKMPVRGLQIGGTTTLEIEGQDLLPEPRLVVDVPIRAQVLLPDATTNKIQLRVDLDDDVSPGLFSLRLANRRGISTSVTVAVDHLPQVAWSEHVNSTPIAIHGHLKGSQVIQTRLDGRAGQRLMIEAEAQRLGSNLRPVIHLYDARRRQIGLAMPATWLAGDSRLVATLPADGRYTIEMHDLQYAAPPLGHYRVKIGGFQFADVAFPPAVQRGQTTQVALIGSDPVSRVQVKATDRLELIPAPRSESHRLTGWRPRILISDVPELLEQEIEGPQDLPKIPVAVSGRLDTARQVDVYRVTVEPGQKLRFEVVADRVNSPIDALLELRDGKGSVLASNDDFGNSTDSRIDYAVPQEVQSLYLAVSDRLDLGHPRCIYRLVAERLSGAARQPSFSLRVAQDTYNVPQGASQVFRVTAARSGYQGPIRLSFVNLPRGVMASGSGIAARANAALITLNGSSAQETSLVTQLVGTSVGVDPMITSIAEYEQHPLKTIQPWMRTEVGLALTVANTIPFRIDWAQPPSESPLVLGTTVKESIKLVRPAGALGPVRLSLVSSEPTPVVNGKPDPNRVVRAQRTIVEVPVDSKAKAALELLVAADQDFATAKKKLLATRDFTAKTVTESQMAVTAAAGRKAASEQVVAQARTRHQMVLARIEQLKIELAAADKSLAAANTTLLASQDELTRVERRLATVAMQAKSETESATAALSAASTAQSVATRNLAQAEASMKKEVEFNVIVPPVLTASAHDLALKAELRSLDNKTVLVETYTPVRRFIPLNPLGIRLPGDPTFVTKLEAETATVVKLTGVVERRTGFSGDVTVSIRGQPKGVEANQVVLKPEHTDFELDLRFPAGFQPREVKTIKVTAAGPPDPKAPKVVVRAETEIVVVLLQAQ